jgi:hypothetical protein
VIEPGEQWSGFGPLTVFQAYPQKSRNLMEAGYRDAKRALAVRRRASERAKRSAAAVPADAVHPVESATGAAPQAVASTPGGAKIVSIGRRER